MKKYIILQIFQFLILLQQSQYLSGQNLALNKSYKLSEIPNYALSAPKDDTSSLTDEIYTEGNFWTQKTTVGWQKKSDVKIEIDLESVQPVGAVSFSTAAGKAQVYFPHNIFVFLSEDNHEYEFAGDMMANAEPQDTSYGTYRNMIFELEEINHSARYVLIVIIPRKTYLFCDEIEILEADRIIKAKKPIRGDKNQIDEMIISLKGGEHDQRNLSLQLDYLPEKVLKKVA